MTRPHEAEGLTIGLANRAHQLAADLAALLQDEIYRSDLCHAAGSPDLAKNANVHLRTAACALAALAGALRIAGEPSEAQP